MNMLNWREAYQEYAQVLEKSVDELTKEERAQAALSAVLETGDKVMGKSLMHHYLLGDDGMDIEHVHDGKFEIGHIDVPFTVRQNEENTLVVEIGGLIDGVPFVGIELIVQSDGEIKLEAVTKGARLQTSSFGNIITGRTGTLR